MRILSIGTQLLVQPDAIFIRQKKRRAARVLAGDRPHGHHAYRPPVARAIQDASNFDASAREPLEPLGYRVPDLLDHNCREYSMVIGLSATFHVANLTSLIAPSPASRAW